MFKSLHFKSLLLMLCMTLGAGQMWAQKVTLDFTSNSDWGLPTSSGTTASASFTDGNGYTITLAASTAYYFNSQSYLMLGKSGSTLTLPAFSFNVSKIVVTGRNGASTNVKQNIFVGTTAVSTETTGATGANTYDIDASYQSAGTIYTLQVTSAHNTQITKIEIWEAGAGTAPDVSIDATTILIGESTIVSTNGPALTLTTDDSTIASVSGTTITGVSEGTTTITASWAAGTVNGVAYTAGSQTFTITVVDVSDGVFDFTKGYNYGSGYETGSVKVQSGTWTAGNVTMVTDGRNCWYNGTSGIDLRIYRENGEDPAGTLTFSVPDGKVITEITFTGNTLSGLTSDKGTYTSGVWTGSASSVVFTANPNDKNIFETITVTYGDAPSVMAPVFGLASGVYAGAQSVELSTTTSGATIYYTTDGTDPDTNSTVYTGAISVSSTTTIKAIAATTDISSTVETATYVITTHDGTLESPYTIAEANEILNNGYAPTDVHVSGIISQINQVNVSDGWATYYISDDGTTTDQLEIYHGKSYDGAAFTSEDEIAVGQNVIVFGSLTVYSGNTNEFKSGSKLVLPATVDAPVIAVEGVSNNVVANVLFKNAQSVNITAADGTTIYYTTDGTEPTTESTVFTAETAISVSTNTTLKAIAVKGTIVSEVSTLQLNFYTKGDLNNDGHPTLNDLTELINILIGNE